MKSERRLERGEWGFLWLLLAFSLFVLFLAAKLFMRDPSPNGEGTFPLIVAVVMAAMVVFSLLEVRKNERPVSNDLSLWGKVVLQVRYIFPNTSVLIFVLVFLYAILLKPIGFIIDTFCFLSISMIALKPQRIIRSLIISAVLVAIIYAIFHLLFKVRLP